MMVLYLIVFIVLVLAMQAYFKIADRYNIIDKPNNRSSHSAITIRGGGIIFPVALILYGLLFNDVPPALMGGILLIGLVSFWDDIKSLPNKVRILFHLLAVSAMLWSIGAYDWPLWAISLAYILIIGAINAYNFMDGINGITGIYSLVILAALAYLNQEVIPFTSRAFIIIPAIACGVFLFYNFRIRARCFAGDVGSVSIGFWVIGLILMLIIETDSLKYILFLAVYGVDAVLTIVHRLLLKQNIFEAHRLHFYQILANECKLNHLMVATLYALIQFLINIFLIITDFNLLISAIIVLFPLGVVYILLKPKWMPKAVLVKEI